MICENKVIKNALQNCSQVVHWSHCDLNAMKCGAYVAQCLAAFASLETFACLTCMHAQLTVNTDVCNLKTLQYSNVFLLNKTYGKSGYFWQGTLTGCCPVCIQVPQCPLTAILRTRE